MTDEAQWTLLEPTETTLAWAIAGIKLCLRCAELEVTEAVRTRRFLRLAARAVSSIDARYVALAAAMMRVHGRNS